MGEGEGEEMGDLQVVKIVLLVGIVGVGNAALGEALWKERKAAHWRW